MTRELHNEDILEFTDESIQGALDSNMHGDVLVVAPEDDRLTSFVPVNNQVTLSGTQLKFGSNAEFYDAPLHNSQRDQPEYIPHNKNERFHYETNSVDTLVSLFSLCGYFQRGPPFMDFTRIVKPGGTIIQLTGLQPDSEPDHNAKWWVSNSSDADLERILALRHADFKTPNLMTVYTVTTDTERHPDATITTGESR